MNTDKKRLRFGRKQQCPCGKSKSYCPLLDAQDGGKCFSDKCGQKFFPPARTTGRGKG